MVKPWDTATIGDFLDFKNGLNKGKEFFGYGTPIVNYTDVYKKRGLKKNDVCGKVSLTRDEIRRFETQKNDVFFTRTSETPEEVGMSSVLLDNIDDCVFSGFVLRGRPKNDMFTPEYCKYCFTTEAVRNAITMGCTYTTRALTNGKQLSAIEIVVPPKPEQEAIAHSLTDIDELMLLLEKQIAKKKAIKQGAMQELLTGKRRLPGFEGEWNKCKLGSLGVFVKGTGISRNQSNSGNLPAVRYGELYTKHQNYVTNYFSHISEEVAANAQRVSRGDILFAASGETKEEIGKCAAIIHETDVYAGGDILIFRPATQLDPAFMGTLLNTADVCKQRAEKGQGDAVVHIHADALSSIDVMIPNIEEQQAIADILLGMDKEIELLESKLGKYRQVKQGMMQQLLTGKIRLTKDIEDSVQTEQVTSEKAMTLRPVHNHQFDDAVAIAAIVDAFYSDKYPLGRVKVQKLLYLLHRHQGVSVSDFKKKAAGPYADTVRYKGGEPIAKKNKYIVSESGKQGTRYSKGTNMGQALDYVERWGMQADLQWLKENFLHTSRNDLELFATVDMAMCDLDEVGISVSVESIKNLIASNNKWKAKLSKTYFSDWDIARAIKKCTELFN